jgi:hypothetical protein
VYGVITAVPAPVALYDGMHAELLRRTGGRIDGLLAHVGRATDEGFEVLEVWESQEHCRRANSDVVLPLMRELMGNQPVPPVQQSTTTFDVHGLVLPRGDVRV